VQSLVTSYVSLASITESDSSTFFPPAEVVSLGSVSFLSGPPVYCDGQETVAGPLRAVPMGEFIAVSMCIKFVDSSSFC
jgi:hypothetical protein